MPEISKMEKANTGWSTYMWNLKKKKKVKIIETETRTAVAKGWRVEGRRKGSGFQ